MAVYRIFPEKDTFIFTENVTANAGKDEILELGGYPMSGDGQTSRMLLQFRLDEIKDAVNNKIGDAYPVYTASLHLSLAAGYELPASYSVHSYPIYDSWVNGTGKYGDSPVDKSGASWAYIQSSPSTEKWTLPAYGAIPANVTGSYSSAYTGGGAWYYQYGGESLNTSQSLSLTDDHDLNLNITKAVDLHYNNSIVNNGYIVKLSNDLEFNTTSSIRLKYYGSDTNTIYPPYLEFKWDDSIYAPGSLSTLSTDDCYIQVTNNRGEYIDEGKQRFRLKARPKYPVHTFSIASAYNTIYALPVASYWALKDNFTDEILVPFDTINTKISCDATGSYFDVYMDGIQPERYYKILIKTTLDGSTTVIDNKDIFKVVRNG